MSPRAQLAVVVVVLLGLLGVQRSRYEELLATNRFRSDSMFSAVRLSSTLRDSLPEAGSRPLGRVVGWTGDTVALGALAPRYRYLYFFRDNCAACEILMPAWTRVRRPVADSVAFIRYSDITQLSADRDKRQFAWLATSGKQRSPIAAVPTLMVLNQDGRVVSVAHASVLRVRDVMDLYHLAPAAAVDSELKRLISRRNIMPSDSLAGRLR